MNSRDHYYQERMNQLQHYINQLELQRQANETYYLNLEAQKVEQEKSELLTALNQDYQNLGNELQHAWDAYHVAAKNEKHAIDNRSLMDKMTGNVDTIKKHHKEARRQMKHVNELEQQKQELELSIENLNVPPTITVTYEDKLAPLVEQAKAELQHLQNEYYVVQNQIPQYAPVEPVTPKLNSPENVSVVPETMVVPELTSAPIFSKSQEEDDQELAAALQAEYDSEQIKTDRIFAENLAAQDNDHIRHKPQPQVTPRPKPANISKKPNNTDEDAPQNAINYLGYFALSLRVETYIALQLAVRGNQIVIEMVQCQRMQMQMLALTQDKHGDVNINMYAAQVDRLAVYGQFGRQTFFGAQQSRQSLAVKAQPAISDDRYTCR